MSPFERIEGNNSEVNPTEGTIEKEGAKEIQRDDLLPKTLHLLRSYLGLETEVEGFPRTPEGKLDFQKINEREQSRKSEAILKLKPLLETFGESLPETHEGMQALEQKLSLENNARLSKIAVEEKEQQRVLMQRLIEARNKDIATEDTEQKKRFEELRKQGLIKDPLRGEYKGNVIFPPLDVINGGNHDLGDGDIDGGDIGGL